MCTGPAVYFHMLSDVSTKCLPFFFVNLWFASGFFTLEFGLVYNINLINGMAKFLLIR